MSSNLTSNTDVPKKRVIPKQTKNDDVDELDDLMGFGGDKQDTFALNKKGGAQERDTLGFLKKSEEEKRRREEEKRNAAQ